jgi:large exoprotein involved in heme utilization and adhesion
VGQLQVGAGGRIDASTTGTGKGGTVAVRATETANLSGGSISTNAVSSGQGGDINLRAPVVNLTDGATISATSTAQGVAGNITIVAPRTFESRGSNVTAEAASVEGGNITILTGNLFRLIDSLITATAGAKGSGGNIVIAGATAALDQPALVTRVNDQTLLNGGPLPRSNFVILENSRISANAFEGPGGRVDIASTVFLQDVSSTVTASSTLGPQGIVNITSPLNEVSGTIARLPESSLQAATLLRESCGARFAEHKTSTLSQVGRDRMPAEPGAASSSPLAGDGLQARELSPVGPGVAMASPRFPVIELRCAKER